MDPHLKQKKEKEIIGPKSEKQRRFLASNADITIFGGEM